MDRFELIKEFASLGKKTANVNFDDNSEDGTKKTNDVQEDEIEKYALENEVTYSEAYKHLNAGKLTVERPNVEEI